MSLSACSPQRMPADHLDTLSFGNEASERSHHLAEMKSESLAGGLGETARRLLPLAEKTWEGGRMAFTMKVAPDQPNYCTFKFWGGEASVNRIILFADGKQIGCRHLGDIDLPDFGSDKPGEFPCIGRYYYWTLPLPESLTRGKTELRLELRATGRIWSYGDTFDKYQKPMEGPTRNVFRVYTHTNGCFTPSPSEKQGAAPNNPSPAMAPGPEVLDDLKNRVNREITARLNDARPLSQVQMQFLAKAYFVAWTPAHQNPKTIARIQGALDEFPRAYGKTPRLAEADPATWNAEWFGLGICGEVLSLLKEQLSPALDAEIDDGKGAKITRRAAYSAMLVHCRDWHTRISPPQRA